MVTYERHFQISAAKANLPYATLLTLNAAGYHAERSIKVEERQDLELNLDGVLITNDASIARFIAQSSGKDALTGKNVFEKAHVDEILTLCEQAMSGFLLSEEVLAAQDFSKTGALFEGRLTVADFALFALIAKDQALQHKHIDLFNAVLNDPSLMEAHSMVGKFQPLSTVGGKRKDISGNGGNNVKEKQKDEGKFIELPGAEKGKVVVRFPPEASGYLHIGHAKAALLNQYYQQAFDGKLIMRFDDTNPAKENAHFEEVIKEDLAMLQIVPDMWTHSSDHFEKMLVMCEKLLREGKAYVDDTDTETMRKEREERAESRCRNTPAEDNLKLWEEMKQGTKRGQQCCVRIKIDMKSNNGAMRDPTIYRCKLEEHVRTGAKYKVYPTYDFACPIVDSVEGVTHTLRTTEYHDRDDQYFFICDALGLRKPHIWEYARLNMTNTVMSKRKLTWFVEENIVEGWDDPRFPTVRGVLRRGMTVEGLKQFIVAQGGSRSVVMMEWDKIWAFNKKVIDPVAPRYTALDKTQSLVTVRIKSSPPDSRAKVALHPKNADVGEKTIYLGSKIFIEQIDANEMKNGDVVTFVNWGNLKIVGVKKNKDCVTVVDAELDLDNKDYKKTLKVTWIGDVAEPKTIPVVGIDYDHIISKAIIGKDEDWKSFINYDSVHYTQMMGEPALRSVKKGDIIQIQRKGFFVCDHAYVEKSEFSGVETPLTLIAIPDGSRKEQPTSTAANKAKAPVPSPAPLEVPASATVLYNALETQGALVRELKAKDAKAQSTKDAVAKLLQLKTEFKEKTGQDYKSGSPPTVAGKSASATGDAITLYSALEAHGQLVRDLKAKDAKSKETKDAIAKLIQLKNDFKEKTGQDYKSGSPPVSVTSAPITNSNSCSNSCSGALSLYNSLEAQGKVVRDLKAKDAKSQETKDAIAKLLQLKNEYKQVTGQEYKSGSPPAQSPHIDAGPQLAKEIEEQGNLVREQKGKDPKAPATKDAIAKLLLLKLKYKETTGKDYTPAVASGHEVHACDQSVESALKKEIEAQGNLVRELKAKDPKSKDTAGAVSKLLQLKASYKEKTGKDYQAATQQKGKGKDEKPKATKTTTTTDAKKANDKLDSKKQSKLGIEVKKGDNYSEWYSEVITKAEMIEYYDVSGCYVLRPWSFAIWETIKKWFDIRIKRLGVRNCYFPMFVSQGALEREKEHIADFAPEVAWVTRAGSSPMAEPIAIRPTSETVMYPSYKKWVQSHRDLPIKLNQWCNVVRWEFKHPTPFLRTREFLWQEGHTAYANPDDAEKEVYQILDLYAGIYEELLAVPVIKGRKSDKEKFAGGKFTTTVEAYIPVNGRGVQGATSHHLGQNFSKMFDISFEDPSGNGQRALAWQNSWGLTTRTIGAMVMVHGDDNGLVLPPRVAAVQVIVMPVGITANTPNDERNKLTSSVNDVVHRLLSSSVRAEADLRDNYSPGWKFNHWELKGVPIRIEIGPKDLAASQVTAVIRYNGEKLSLHLADLETRISEILESIHKAMFAAVKSQRDEHLKVCNDFDEFKGLLDAKCIVLSAFCGRPLCEDNVKRDSQREEGEGAQMGAKTLCIPFEQPLDALPQKCFHPECNEKPLAYALFGRSY